MYAKFNIKIYFSSCHLREAWYYKDVHTGLIKRANGKFNWQRVFLNTSISMKKLIFSPKMLLTLLLILFQIFQTVLWDNGDPPWFNKQIRTLIKEKIRHLIDIITNVPILNSKIIWSSSKKIYMSQPSLLFKCITT